MPLLQGRPLAGHVKNGRTTMRMVCSWCDATIAKGDGNGPTSHGACPACAREMIAEIAIRSLSDLIAAVDTHGRHSREAVRACRLTTRCIRDVVGLPSENGPDGDASQRVESRRDQPPGGDDSKLAGADGAGNSGRNRGRYVIEVGSPGGPVAEYRYATFDELLADVERVAEKHRGPYRALAFGNIDRADVDTDGITDEERERLAEAGW